MRAILILASLALGALSPPALADYNCSKTACRCAGTQDCKDMRDSGFCKNGTISCNGNPPICNCEAALIDPGSAGSVPKTRVVPGGIQGGVIDGTTSGPAEAPAGGGVMQQQ